MDVYVVYVDFDAVSQAGLREMAAALSRKRQDRLARLLRREDQCRCAVAGLLERFMFRARFGRQAEIPEIATNPYGKPAYKDVPGFAFNLSHSGNWVVGVADAAPVGIDIEKVDCKKGILHNVLSGDEKEWLGQLPEARRGDAFFDLWALKEAYVKAVGKGLYLPLNEVSFHAVAGQSAVQTQGVPHAGWYFRSYAIDPDYKMAVCAAHHNFPNKVVVLESQALFTLPDKNTAIL